MNSFYTLEDVTWDKNNIKIVEDTPLVMSFCAACGSTKPSFSSLPTDIIHHILSYDETLKMRNGKYMGRISKSDKRYELLLKISRKIYKIYTNYGYFVKVNEFLKITIYLFFYSEPLEYDYNFIGRTVITYLPK